MYSMPSRKTDCCQYSNMKRTLSPILRQDFAELEQLPLPWESLRDKRIFMTGGTGFIGRYLVQFLSWLNERKRLDLTLMLLHRGTAPPPFSDSHIHWITGDITSDFIPADFTTDMIIHAASPANWQAISADPSGVINCNIMAVRYVLEYARKNHSTVVYFGSGEVYRRRHGRIKEEDAGTLAKESRLSLYANSKLSGELLCENYRQKYGIDCRALRLFSIFGPGENLKSGRCFTDFLFQLLESNSIQITGPGTQIRSFCYLSDFVSGLLYVLLKGGSTVYNIGNEDNTCSLLELAKEMAAVYGNADVVGPAAADAAESCADWFVPDTAKLRRLGWRPQIDLQICIRRCLDSYQEEYRL